MKKVLGATKSMSEQTPAPDGPEDKSEDKIEGLPAVLASALRTAGIDTHDPAVSKALEISTTMFGGSLPFVPPQILREYKEIDPGLVQKLIEWTEDQAKHRRRLEVRRTARAENRLDRGQYIAGALAISGLILATIEGILGSAQAAAVIAAVSVGGPTAAIWLAQSIRKREAASASASKRNRKP
jgi:uncharacterized membrane protein